MTRFRYSSKFVLTLVVSILLHSVLGAGEDSDISKCSCHKLCFSALDVGLCGAADVGVIVLYLACYCLYLYTAKIVNSSLQEVGMLQKAEVVNLLWPS